MAQSVTIWHSGAVTGQPLAVPGGPSLSDMMNTSFSNTYTASQSSRLSVVGATDSVPFVVALGSVVKVHFLGLRVINGSSIKVLLTSPSGTDQALKTSSLLLWHSPNSGDEFTAIKLVGTADIELLIVGNVS